MKLENPTVIGTIVRQARTLCDMTTEAVAAAAGVTQGTVTSVEGGRSGAHYESTLRGIAAAVGLTPQAVVDEDLETLRADLHAMVAPDLRPDLRTTVLLRDRHTCRYCGRSRGEHGAVLHAVLQDRSLPSSEANAVTACELCRVGLATIEVRPAPGLPPEKEDTSVRYRVLPWDHFAAGVRYLRERPGLSEREFAEYVDCPVELVRRAEDPDVVMELDEVAQITTAFGATIEDVCEQRTDQMADLDAYREHCRRVEERREDARAQVAEAAVDPESGLPASEMELLEDAVRGEDAFGGNDR